MSFARILGHDRPLRLIRRALETGRLPHALLFSGPDGVGKLTVARELGKALNCAVEAGRDACDACPSCRLADRGERGEHPDILIVGPAGRSLKIDQIREVERHAALSPYAGRRRVAIVDAAGATNPPGPDRLPQTPPGAPGGRRAHPGLGGVDRIAAHHPVPLPGGAVRVAVR